MSKPQLLWKPQAVLFISLFFLAFGLLCLELLLFDSGNNLFSWLLAGIYIFPSLFGVVYSLRTRVEADETGVRWRDWHGVWRAAKWDEISDLHVSSETKNSTRTVETASGNFQFNKEGDGKAIAEIVPQRAKNALTRKWEIKGERLVDEWPRRFEFYDKGCESAAKVGLFVLLASLGLMAYLLAFRLPPRADLPASEWFLAYAAPILLLPLLPFLVWLFLFIGARQARPFRGQNLDISPLGVVFNGATRLEAKWSQIEGWHWISKRRVRFLQLQTSSDVIEIPTFIAGFGALCRILERFSGASLVTAHGEETMALHPIQNSPDGTLIFRFSSIDVQLFRWLLPILGLTMCLMPFLMRLADPQSPTPDEPSAFAFGFALFMLALLLEWWLGVAQLRLTPEFLEWRVPFKKREIAWAQIERFGSATGKSGWIEVAGEKISLSPFGASICQGSRLHAEIEKRAFNATGEWK